MMNNKFDFLIIIDWLVTPLMEIGAEIALEKHHKINKFLY